RGGGGGPQAEAVMVLRGEDHVLRPDVAGQAHPLVGVEIAGVEDVRGEGSVAPFLAGEGVHAEVEEDAEAVSLPGELLGSGDKRMRRCGFHGTSQSNLGPLREGTARRCPMIGRSWQNVGGYIGSL